MRRGRALLPHPKPRTDDTGRALVSRYAAAHLTGRNVDHVRKRVPTVACDVQTRVALVDLDEAEAVFRGRPQRNTRRTVSQA